MTYVSYRSYGENNHSRTLYAGESRIHAIDALFDTHPDVLDLHGLRVLEEWLYGLCKRRFHVSKDDKGNYELMEPEV